MLELFLYVLVVLSLLVSELKDDTLSQYFFKPLAALGFVLLAIYCGALESLYGQIILGGLVFCAIGDVFLLSRKSEKLFQIGMFAFALGHIFYVIAFVSQGALKGIISGGFREYTPIALIVILGILSYRRLRPHLEKSMLFAVALYIFIIMVMVTLSESIPKRAPFILVQVAAMMFAVSDMFVARDRFVKREPRNALAITPLYFGAQALFALSTQI